MVPLLNDGAEVHIQSKRYYFPGDVLVFRNHSGQVCIHRFLGCYPRHGRFRYLTKADAGRNPDASIERQNIIGKVIGGEASPLLSKVPFIHRMRAFGYFIRFVVHRLILTRFKNGLWR